MNNYFISFDGDDVGRRLEYYVLMNDYLSLREFSDTFNNSMKKLIDDLIDILHADIIFFGGDNLLCSCYAKKTELIHWLDRYREMFEHTSSSTISIGIGHTSQQSYFALKIAKASGKNKIIFYEGQAL